MMGFGMKVEEPARHDGPMDMDSGIRSPGKQDPLEGFLLAHALGRLVLGCAWQEVDGQRVSPTVDPAGEWAEGSCKPFVLFPAYEVTVTLVPNGGGVAQNFAVAPLFWLLHADTCRVPADAWRMAASRCTAEERRVMASGVENLQRLVADMRKAHERATGAPPKIILPGR
jgi:hypothetical protein